MTLDRPGWEPSVLLRDGLAANYRWIEQEMISSGARRRTAGNQCPDDENRSLSLSGWKRGDRMDLNSPFADIPTAVEEIRAGRMIVVVDDENRENEGDLTMAAEKITPEAVNFMARFGRGLICLAMTPERLDHLGLRPMTPHNTARLGTAFTESIDALGHGVTTGISAHDRAQTIRCAIDPGTHPAELGRPGHIFPLRAQSAGVLARPGQTEAAVDLARLAGLTPAGVICEIMNDDGTMARVPDLALFCRQHAMKMITVADLIRYRREYDLPLVGIATAHFEERSLIAAD
jgi:3,4-dihydroxy 2-butanone 4-phosphate synthase / GTP cyclohydrolase II